MAKRKKQQQRKPKKKKSGAYVYYGCGILFLLFFAWFWYSSNEDITQSQLRTFSGQLSTELVKKSSGGAKKKYSWNFTLKDQPEIFTIKSNAYSVFNSEQFRKNEAVGSVLKMQTFKQPQNEQWTVVTLSSQNQYYITLGQMNDKRETDETVSYLLLIIGIACIVAGIRGK